LDIPEFLQDDISDMELDEFESLFIADLLGTTTDSVDDTLRPVLTGFEAQTQSMSKWCWAAVGSMVSKFYSGRDGQIRDLKQCDLASKNPKLNPGLDCCADDPMSRTQCNMTNLLSNVLNTIGRSHKFENHVPDHKSFDLIHKQITELERLVPIRIVRSDGTGHFFIVCGYRQEENVFAVWDPIGMWHLERTDSFERQFNGEWTHTYILK